MKGIVHNLLETIVVREYGLEQWEALLAASRSDGVYTSLGNYPDEEMQALVGAAAAALGMPAFEALRWFGQQAMPLLQQRYPDFFRPHRTTRAFVLSTNDIIHPQVRMLYPGAMCPRFGFADDGEWLLMEYRSPRRMCALAQGFVEGAAPLFQESVIFEHRQCTSRGDERCLCAMKFAPVAVAA